MIKSIQDEANRRMHKSVQSLQEDLAKVRSGRAHPSLLEGLMVSHYGSEMPLNQLASISVADARTVQIQAWDRSAVAAIEKAIMNSDLGLNPMTAGELIRVPLPPLTEERRRSLIKIVKQEGENARVAVRNVRRDANSQFKDLLKSKDVTEDEARRAEEAVQKLTDKTVAEIDGLLRAKEAELMEI